MSSRWRLPSHFLVLAAVLPLGVPGCAGRQARPMGIETESAASTAEPEPPATPRTAEQASAGPVVSKEPRRMTGNIRRAELNAVLDAAPGRFLAHVETEPRFVGGRFRGWRLASFFPGDARFAAVDLEAGDVVLSVNGQSIEQPDQLMRVWDSLRSERALIVAIERDGQPRQLRYEIRE